MNDSSAARLREKVQAALKRRSEAGTSAAAPEIPRRPAGQPALASFAQERMWFLNRLDADDPTYNVPLVVRIEGPLHPPALREALHEIVRRHESLRTSFIERDGRPWLSVAAEFSLDLEELEADRLGNEHELDRLIQDRTRQPFDLTKAPLARAVLVRSSRNRHVLLWICHHIICDQWSHTVLLRELGEIYAALRTGRDPTLPSLTIDYSDYAAWQREDCQGQRLDRLMRFWRDQLRGDSSPLELPADRHRPPVRTTRGGEVVSTLSPELIAAAEHLSARHGVTLFTTLLAAFNVLLYRLTQQTDVTVGVPSSARSHPETEPLIGLFINTLPIRANLAGDPTFNDFLLRTRDAFYGGLDHQDLPLEKLVAELQPARRPDRSPLFDVMLNLHSVAAPAMLDDCRIAIDVPANGTAKLDLAVTLKPCTRGLVAAWEYNRDLYDEDRVRRWSAHFGTLLLNLVTDPGRSIGAVPLLTEPERRQLLVDFNAGHEEFGREAALHRLFEEQVRLAPQAVALVCGDRRLTYDELNRRANRLARHLTRAALPPETLVGVCLERSVELVVALIAVLKAGDAYVPLDPTYPAVRLRFMLEDSGVSMVVTNQLLARRLPAGQARPVLLDVEADAIAREADDNLDTSVVSRQLAYVLFTSGSTGRPKGVAIEHAGPVALADWAWRTFSHAQLEGMLGSTSVCFDLSVFEIFVPLAGGGKVILVRDLLHFPDAPAAREVTFVNTVPSAMEELLRLGGMPAVRVIGLAGEPLPSLLARRCTQLPGNPHVWNLYGPTEDTVYSTAARIEPAVDTSPPIGRPVAGSRACILEPSGQPAPVGVPGELHLGGLKLARGYLNRPELTQERFVPDPFSPHSGARLYRTGDRARWRADGMIEFLGRLDHQVKVRGFRIELSEIQSVLNEHAAVRESVVVAAGEGGGRRLVAYLAPAAGWPASEDDLRRHLTGRLPDYMVPSRFVHLDALPRTASGKIDRRALPEPGPPQPGPGSPPARPLRGTEIRLAKIFQEMLDPGAVGPDAHFFELGGHSLLATLLVARIREEFAVPIALRRVFDEPTVAGLARCIDGHITEIPGHAHGEDPSSGPALSFAQEGLWLFHQLLPETTLFHLGYRFTLRGAVNVDALQASLDEIIRRHEALRTGFGARDVLPEVVVAPPCRTPLHRSELDAVPEEDRECAIDRAAQIFVREPFDLARPPLFRALLLRVNAEHHVLVIATHHIVFDGWSRSILHEELATLYEAFRAGKPSALPPVRFQCGDFARRQRRILEGDRRLRLMDHWKTRLEGAPAILDLPLDFPRPPRQVHSGKRETLALDAPISTALKELGRVHQATPFMVLLAAFATTLSRWSGQEDMLIGVPLAGRDDPDVQRTIGMFVNVMPVRVDLRENPPFVEVLRQVRGTALDAYEHQDLPLELLLRELRVERRADVAALFQVALNYQSHPATRRSSIALEMETDGVDIESSRFDLTLYVRDEGETLQASLAYDKSLFHPETARRLLDRFRTLLDAIASQPHRRVSALSLLTESERHVLRNRRNTIVPRQDFVAFSDVEIEQSVGARFRQQVARHGDCPAVACADGDWTYARLHAEALRVAAAIMAAEASGSRAALVFEPGGAMLAAILGSLLAGAAYVPLDPRHPSARLRALVEDCTPAVILADSRCRAAADAISTPGCPLLVVDELPTPTDEVALPEVRPDDLAYVIYTSGSTGEPKGVMQSHRNLLHHMRAYTNALHLCAEDRVAMLAPYTTDLAVMDLFGALLNGARLVPIDLRGLVESRIARTLDDERISVLHLTPTVYRWLLSTVPGDRQFPSVRMLVLGGEAARIRDVELYRRHFSRDCLLVNGLGPTESTLALQCFFDHSGPACGRRVPVGYPVQETEILLLDEAGEPADLLGEIAIKSRHLALGYWRRPDLTRAAFVDSPEGDGRRIYRTGDQGRMRDDGRIEFLGRKDEQVKIRGLGVEPAEIEGVLVRNPAVREAVVVACEEADAETWMAAHVVRRIGHEHVSERELLEYLDSRLPAHMVPAVVVFADSLPRTRADKVDRRALPRPERRGREVFRQVIASRDPIEQVVAAIWEGILRTGQVSVQDDFLDLGGDSLQAMRVLSHLRSATGVELSMADFFHQPTVEAQARRIKAARQERPDHPAIKLKNAREAAGRARLQIATATSANDNLDLRRPTRRRGPAPE